MNQNACHAVADYPGVSFYLWVGLNDFFNLIHDSYRELHITSGGRADRDKKGTRVFVGDQTCFRVIHQEYNKDNRTDE